MNKKIAVIVPAYIPELNEKQLSQYLIGLQNFCY